MKIRRIGGAPHARNAPHIGALISAVTGEENVQGKRVMNQHEHHDVPMGGLAVFLGTLITIGIFAFLLGSTKLEIGLRAALDQQTTHHVAQHD
jgi:hypothetical protein